MSERFKSLSLSRRAVLGLGARIGAGLFLTACGAPPARFSNYTSETAGSSAAAPGNGDIPPSPTAVRVQIRGGFSAEVTPVPTSSSGYIEPIPTTATDALPPSGTHVTIQNGEVIINVDEYRNETCNPGPIPQPLALAIVHNFGTGIEAAQAAVVAWSESTDYDQFATNVNAGGSVDIGYFQINSIHLARMQGELGIESMEDLYDPEFNVAAARIIFEGAGRTWRDWQGPLRVGCQVPR